MIIISIPDEVATFITNTGVDVAGELLVASIDKAFSGEHTLPDYLEGIFEEIEVISE